MRAAWVDRQSASGYVFIRAALRAKGVSLVDAFHEDLFLRSHAEVARAGGAGVESNQWSGGNYLRWSNKDYDAIFEQLRKELDPAKRAEIVKKMHDDTAKLLDEPETRKKYENLGIEAAGATADEMTAMMKHEVALWGPVIKAANIRGE